MILLETNLDKEALLSPQLFFSSEELDAGGVDTGVGVEVLGLGSRFGVVSGEMMGEIEGERVGATVGEIVGEMVGDIVGEMVGEIVGSRVTGLLSDWDDLSLGTGFDVLLVVVTGEILGERVGESVGDSVGETVGEMLGEIVGSRVTRLLPDSDDPSESQLPAFNASTEGQLSGISPSYP